MALKGILITFAAAAFVVSGTILAISWARGYRPDLKNGSLVPTGLLVANSFPTGAQVYIDESLTTATDNTINMAPGDYHIKITKDGYLAWEKNLKLQKELVTQTNALLFPAAPDLKALTFTGAVNPIPSPDGQKIAYTIASASAMAKNGLYILDMSSRTLSFRAENRQIASQADFNFTASKFLWSPDSTQIVAYRQATGGEIVNVVILDANRTNNDAASATTSQLAILLDDWNEQLKIKRDDRWGKLPDKLRQILEENGKDIHWSPDEEKILYTATASASIPHGLLPQLPASSTQDEMRQLEAGKIYIYDAKEDRNFLVGQAKLEPKIEQDLPAILDQIESIRNQYTPIWKSSIQWFPDSRHLISVEEGKIMALEYDGTNKVTVYGGPLNGLQERAFVYPAPDASKLVILTTLNQDQPENLYAVNLK